MPQLFSEQSLQNLATWTQRTILKDLCDILAISGTWDTEGGRPDTLTTIQTGLPCAIVYARPKIDKVLDEQVLSRVYDTVLLPRGTVVLGGNLLRITITENGIATTQTYRVVGLYSPQAYEVCTMVDVIYDPRL